MSSILSSFTTVGKYKLRYRYKDNGYGTEYIENYTRCFKKQPFNVEQHQIHVRWNSGHYERRLGCYGHKFEMYDHSEKIEKIDGFREDNLWVTKNGNVVCSTDETINIRNIYGSIEKVKKNNMNILCEIHKCDDNGDSDSDSDSDSNSNSNSNKIKNTTSVLFENADDVTIGPEKIYTRNEKKKNTKDTQFCKTKKGHKEHNQNIREEKWKINKKNKEGKEKWKIKKERIENQKKITKSRKMERKIKTMYKPVESPVGYEWNKIDASLVDSFMDADAYNIFINHDDEDFIRQVGRHNKIYIKHKLHAIKKQYLMKLGHKCQCEFCIYSHEYDNSYGSPYY